jgi:Ricin-type beta-trefoil lectin domain
MKVLIPRIGRRAVLWSLAMLLAITAAVLARPPVARADTGSNVTNWGAGSGQCLDANLSGYGPGSKVQTWQCWGGANQHWYTDYNNCQYPGDGYYYCLVRNGYNTNMCLYAAGAGNGASVFIDYCNASSRYDTWLYNSSQGILWLNAGSYMVLDLNRSCEGSNGCNVQVWSWWGANNQRWSGYDL